MEQENWSSPCSVMTSALSTIHIIRQTTKILEKENGHVLYRMRMPYHLGREMPQLL